MHFLSVFLLLAGLVTSSQAADIPLKAQRSTVTTAHHWTGFYVGLHAGGARSTTTSSATDRAALIAVFGGVPDPSGVFGGAQLGYNYQLPNNVVLGFEVSGGGGPGFSDTVSNPVASLKSEMRWYTFVTGRVGYAFDRWMPYVLGGGAWAGLRATSVTLAGSAVLRNTHPGFVVGGGLAYAMTPNFSIAGEFRYVDLSARPYGLVSTGSEVSAVSLRGDYRF